MPRISYIDDSRKTPQITALIESAQKTGAPDPRVVSIMTRSEVGTAWVECWNKVLYKGLLPHKLKEMCRIKISVAHQCGYCSTVRSNVAKGEGLTENVINELGSYQTSGYFTAREKAALHYADLFKQGEHAIDKDEVYDELKKHFSEEEIIEVHRWRLGPRTRPGSGRGASNRQRSQRQSQRGTSRVEASAARIVGYRVSTAPA